MAVTNRILSSLLSAVISLIVFTAYADNDITQKKPNFKDYPTRVSKGPFATELNLTNKEKNYSNHWKKITTSELKKPANLAGHYRIFTDDKSSSGECLDHKGGVCGWVIDKLSGKIVTTLPFIDGTNI